MSNLVGCWALVWDQEQLRHTVFVYGKADDSVYLVQFINALTGEPNLLKLYHLKDMMAWDFFDNRELLDEILAKYHDSGRYPYRIKKPQDGELI